MLAFKPIYLIRTHTRNAIQAINTVNLSQRTLTHDALIVLSEAKRVFLPCKFYHTVGGYFR